MPKNPFEFFGLTPELAADLSERELFTVLKAMYRALLKNVHPDLTAHRPHTTKAGVNANRAVELNLAFEALNLDKDPASFRRHRKAFVARRPRSLYQKTLELENEIVLANLRRAALADAYLSRLVTDAGWGPPAGAAPFPPRNVRLGLVDVAINQNLKMASWSLGSNYKQLQVDEAGRISIKAVGRRRFTQAAFIHLLGSIPMDEIELLPLLERPPAEFFKAPALNARIGANGPALSVLNRISQEKFKAQALTRLRPLLTERAYLFSLNRAEFQETGCLSLEGLIVKLDSL